MDKIQYSGKLFQVIKREQSFTFQNQGNTVQKSLSYELVRRPPGVRAIVIKEEKVLLNKEFRYELGNWDYRLPGGKVYDSNSEYVFALNSESLEKDIRTRLEKELNEEAEIAVKECSLFEVSHCGLTVDWDIYYFVVNSFQILPTFYDNNTRVSEYEYVEHFWIPFSEIFDLVINGMISEERSAIALLKYLYREGKLNVSK